MSFNKLLVPILDLGNMQAFCWQTANEIAEKIAHKDVSWRDKSSGYTYGPFPNLYEAMKHYTWFVESQGKKVDTAQVIFVDFSNKKRIVYG